MKSLLLLFVMASGCYAEWKAEDIDGDGVSVAEGDCWESTLDPTPPEGALNHGVTAADIHTGAEDLPYDGIDANCDGKDDFDVDGDGYVPAEFAGIKTLGLPDSGGLLAGDCFDSIEEVLSDTSVSGVVESSFFGADIHPEGEDIFYDGIDSDCSGNDDFDADGDGFTATRFEGVVTQFSGNEPLPSGDCFDIDTDNFDDPTGGLSPAVVHPTAIETWYDGADQNCDAQSDCDQDGDGAEVLVDFCAALIIDMIDCNDEDGTIFPSPEISEIYYNGIDDNCDLTDGDGDQDGDGHWDINYPFTEEQVDVSVLYPATLDDCWDDQNNVPENMDAINGFSTLTAADVSPSAIERFYDGADQNCDGLSDFDADQDGFFTEHYPDRDGSTGNDCVDSETDSEFVAGQGITPADIYPNNPTETWYDGNDQNCDDANDFDQDGDGQTATGYPNGVDCNDTDSTIFFDPNLNDTDEYVDDGVDQNCDGLELCYLDDDHDTYGNSAGNTGESSDLSCLAIGFATNTNDCNDADGSVYPNAPSICDGQFNDCLNTTLPSDEIDNDLDGYVECVWDAGGWDGTSLVVGGDDCDDDDAILNPAQVWYHDGDSDTYGDLDDSLVSCLQPANFILDSTDCDDGDSTVKPGASELCDGQDNDCNGFILPVESDLDGDRYVDCTWDAGGWDGDPNILGGDDCNDAVGTGGGIHPGATEGLNDGVDQNCDLKELCPVDADLDTFGDSTTATGLSTAMDCFQTGFSGFDTDCDDNNPHAFPGAASIDSSTACMLDLDGDEYGDMAPSNTSITSGMDCNDSEATINPAAIEGSNDGIDQNCDNQELCYIDSDQDGYGNIGGNTSLSSTLTCITLGFSNVADDCDDNDETVYPNATELCDGQFNDCNNQVLRLEEIDNDLDGYVECTWDAGGWDGVIMSGGDDCDDNNPWLYPSGTEWCDGIANICNTVLDENEQDDDGDGYVECNNWIGAQAISGGDDCNDGDDTVYPSAAELCDGQFNNCYAGNYDASSAPNIELDTDGDFYVECENWSGSNSIFGGGDCAPSNPSIYPSATEGFNDGVDQNCDELELCPVDSDLDNFGSPSVSGLSSSLTCNQAGFSSVTTDCDDTNEFAHPGAASVDSLTDCMLDADQDNYGDVSPYSSAIIAGSDCNDANSAINPVATEGTNDGIDQNCDNQESCYIDSDHDTSGNASGNTGLSSSLSCDSEVGYANNTDDCDDNDADLNQYDEDGDGETTCDGDCNDLSGAGFAINSAAIETCDEIDNDCDGDIDENVKTTFFKDFDGDGYGDSASTQDACSAPLTYILDNTDCDDIDPAVHPNATEICDGQYNNCDDGAYDENSAPVNERDGDGDNYVDCAYDISTWAGSNVIVGGNDCDDTDGEVYPTAPEACDGRWTDCNSQVVPADELDDDFDGYVECAYNASSWEGVAVTGGGDCDDNDIDAYPGAFEIIEDTIDQDCDGSDLTGIRVAELSVNDLIITEIMPDGISDPSDEWFEVYNTTSEIIDIMGLYLGDTANVNAVDFTVPDHYNIAPGEYFLFMNNADPVENGGFTPTEGAYVDYTSFALTNSGDSIFLYTDTITVTEISYDTDFLYSDGVSTSVSDVSVLANNSAGLWCSSSSLAYVDASNGNQPYYGTPGEANDDCDADGDGDFVGLDCDDDDDTLNLDDADGDGQTTCAGDCDDTVGSGAAINSAATEICDGIDNDCDGDIDDDDLSLDPSGTGTTFYLDADGDGYGDNAFPDVTCAQQANYVSDNTDCDDGDDAIHPLADESDADSVDSNCDGAEADANVSNCYSLAYTNNFAGYDKYFLLCYAPNYTTSWRWTDANDFCVLKGYEGLASILNQTENDIVGSLITGAAIDLSGRNAHIGVNDRDTEGTYVWSNGNVLDYTNWQLDEPNGGNTENCTEFYNTANTWNDLACSVKRDFVCAATILH